MRPRTRQLPHPPCSPSPSLLCRLLFRESTTTFSSHSGPLKTREAGCLQETWTCPAAQGPRAGLLVFYFVLFCSVLFYYLPSSLWAAGEFPLEAGNRGHGPDPGPGDSEDVVCRAPSQPWGALGWLWGWPRGCQHFLEESSFYTAVFDMPGHGQLGTLSCYYYSLGQPVINERP